MEMYAIKQQRYFRSIVEIGTLEEMTQKCIGLNAELAKDVFLDQANYHYVISLGEKFNGWINRETWLIFTWLTDDMAFPYGKTAKCLMAYDAGDYASVAIGIERLILISDAITQTCIALDLSYGEQPFGFDAHNFLLSYFRSRANKIVWADVIKALRETILGE